MQNFAHTVTICFLQNRYCSLNFWCAQIVPWKMKLNYEYFTFVGSTFDDCSVDNINHTKTLEFQHSIHSGISSIHISTYLISPILFSNMSNISPILSCTIKFTIMIIDTRKIIYCWISTNVSLFLVTWKFSNSTISVITAITTKHYLLFCSFIKKEKKKLHFWVKREVKVMRVIPWWLCHTINEVHNTCKKKEEVDTSKSKIYSLYYMNST